MSLDGRGCRVWRAGRAAARAGGRGRAGRAGRLAAGAGAAVPVRGRRALARDPQHHGGRGEQLGGGQHGPDHRLQPLAGHRAQPRRGHGDVRRRVRKQVETRSTWTVMTRLSMFSYFSNDFELKEFGWFDTDCGYTGSYVSGWQLQTRALCEREVTRA